MPLKIFGTVRSRAFRTIWLAEELGLDYQVIEVAPAEAGDHPTLRAVNPNARIPAIDDDGFVLWESMAINLYLVGKHGGPLAARDAAENGRILMWTFWSVTECEGLALQLLRNRELLPENRRDEAMAREAIAALDRPFKVIEAALERSENLAAERFTVADLNVATVIAWAKRARMDLAPYPRLTGWLSRCLSRPPARKTTLRLRG